MEIIHLTLHKSIFIAQVLATYAMYIIINYDRPTGNHLYIVISTSVLIKKRQATAAAAERERERQRHPGNENGCIVLASSGGYCGRLF